MAKYRIYKNNNTKSSGYGKFYAKKVAGGLVEVDELIEHMAGHNTSFSPGTISGVLRDMVSCIRELAYEGKSVKIDNLGIFSVSMKSKGTATADDFDAASCITSKWQVRPTGAVLRKAIGVTRAAGAFISWEEEKNYTSPRTKKTAAEGTAASGTTDSQQGSTTGGGTTGGGTTGGSTGGDDSQGGGGSGLE